MHALSKFNAIKKFILTAALAATMTTQLTGCFGVVAAGVATGGAMAADRRSSGIYVEDENIELKAVKFMETNLGEHAHVNVTSYNRNVLITGEVPDEAAKAKAEAAVKAIANVRNVTDELVVGAKSGLSSRSNDTYLTSKVKSQFVTENKFSANYVKVITENSVVYLLGLVNKAEADAATEIASNTDGVAKVVKVFEYIN